MAYSYVQYVGNNSTVTFSVPFPYISKAHVEVRINNVLKTVGTDYTWSSTSAITFVTAPGTGLTVDIRRKSSPNARLVDFQDGSTLTQDILDADSNQNFFLAQEATDAVAANIALDTDGVFDAKDKRIKNVADPVNAQDAVTKVWAETANSSNVAQSTAQAAASAASAAASLSSANASAASATSASGSAATATTKASEASTSATNAASSATSANNSKVAAATSETNAAASAAAAASSASSASSSAASATGSANSASNSAATATTKASDAAGSATQAANSATGAATSATNAASSASSASGSATSAASSASSASTSATNAASSATSASGSASTATTKAAEAAASATTATTQATTATTKASEAAASAVSAANSAAAAATALDNFDDRYLGQKTADPTLDNDGNALVTGALYFNSSTGKMRVFTGSGWIDASSASVATLAVFNYTATAGQTTFSGNDAAGVNLVYTVGAVIVTLNGIDQKNGVDYTATNGSSIVLTSAAAAGDELRVYAFGNFQVADTYSQAAANALLAQKLDKSGGTMTGALAVEQTVYSDIAWNTVRNLQNTSANNYGVGIKLAGSSTGEPTKYAAIYADTELGGADGWFNKINLHFQTKPDVSSSPRDVMKIDYAGRVTMPYQVSFNVGATGYGDAVSGTSSSSPIQYNQVNHNVGNCFNTATGLFTAPVTGSYIIRAHQLTANATQSSCMMFMLINGSIYHECYLNNLTSHSTANISGIYKLAAGDTVGIALPNGLWYRSSSAHSQFSGMLIG